MKRIYLALLTCVIVLVSCSKAENPFQLPDTPSLLERVATYHTIGDPLHFDISENYVFVAEHQTGFSIFNRHTSNLYQRVSETAEVEGGRLQLRDTRFVRYVSGRDYLFILDRTRANLQTLFFAIIEDPTSPISVELARHQTGFTLNDMHYELDMGNDNVFFTYWSQELDGGVMAMQRRRFLRRVGPWGDTSTPVYNIRIPNHINGMAVTDDNHMILAIGQGGIHIVANNLDSFSNVSMIVTPGNATDVAFKDGFIYVAAMQRGLQVIDATDISDPVYLPDSGVNTSGNASSVDIFENYLAVGSRAGGLYLFDISTPYDPVLLQRLRLSDIGFVNMVKFCSFDGNLYVASREQGLVRFEIIPRD